MQHMRICGACSIHCNPASGAHMEEVAIMREYQRFPIRLAIVLSLTACGQTKTWASARLGQGVRW
jgi:hypothetical protein